jgi:hypothetical protein
MIRAVFTTVLVLGSAVPGGAQVLTHRGHIESRAFLFPQDAALDRQNLVVDVLAREELVARPSQWFQIQAGVDLRANTGDQVADSWVPDLRDRGLKRPILSVRRLAGIAARGPVTIEAGKQFIRWGKTDIVTPTDRFAPRDYLNVFDSEFLAVQGVRAIGQLADHTIDVVWAPAFTPSRIPLASKRWTVLPPDAPALEAVERRLPEGSQAGVRWGYTGGAYEVSLSWFDGFNHLPIIEPALGIGPLDPTRAGALDSARAGFAPLAVAIRFPSMRMYGADAVLPTRWLTVKAEGGYFTSEHPNADEYLLYVLQLERQQGEWLWIGGYAGEAVTRRRAPGRFAPDRGMTSSFVGRASYTIGPTRSAAIETAVRENLDGVYLKAEYSQAHGVHWRSTVTVAILRGDAGDFLGQYRRNSHAIVGLRYSF